MSAVMLASVNSEANTMGLALRKLREHTGLSTRDVEAGSLEIARERGNARYAIPISRLCEFETRGTIPSIYRLYTLSVIYQLELQYLLYLYGIVSEPSISGADTDSSVASAHRSYVRTAPPINLPILPKHLVNSRRTVYIGRIVGELTEVLPLSLFGHFLNSDSTYGYIGGEDYTMWPLLPPASLVQIDESCNRVASGTWASEYERPIYFVETRERYLCCWCTSTRDGLVLTPHPLSPVQPRILQHNDAEVLGQVVGAVIMLRRSRVAVDPSPKTFRAGGKATSKDHFQATSIKNGSAVNCR